jgi:hypothetical protein
MFRPALISVFTACGLLVLSGCGGGSDLPATVKAEGKVTIGGNPAPKGVMVTLLPVSGGRPAVGTTDDQGHFVLSTFGDKDGAVPGDHYVGVVYAEVSGTISADPYGGSPSLEEQQKALKVKKLVPDQYSVPEQSGIQTTIPAEGTDQIQIEI